ncbi:hypothetical protein GOODEAATRI_024471 [Goodea atripinnis]|uniref:Uncharacterized protein n=1 Tax=Goodea atripinnis TaxID=208336 RepID=A0ABV0P019_9TELE
MKSSSRRWSKEKRRVARGGGGGGEGRKRATRSGKELTIRLEGPLSAVFAASIGGVQRLTEVIGCSDVERDAKPKNTAKYSVVDYVFSPRISLLDPPTPHRRVEERRIRIL